MRFISIHKSDAATEAEAPLRPEVMEGIGKLCGDTAAAGILLAGEGLRATRHGVRVRFRNGERIVQPGPFEGEDELFAGFAIVAASSIDEAIEHATRFAAIAAPAGRLDIDIRPFVEPWQLGICPPPPELPRTRYMIGHKATPESEGGVLPGPEARAALERFGAELTRSGALLGTVRQQPSSKGKRVRYRGGRQTVLDGPFTESKELIAGFAILRLPTLEEAVAWTVPFAAVLGDTELDVRPLYEPDEPSWGWLTP